MPDASNSSPSSMAQRVGLQVVERVDAAEEGLRGAAGRETLVYATTPSSSLASSGCVASPQGPNLLASLLGLSGALRLSGSRNDAQIRRRVATSRRGLADGDLDEDVLALYSPSGFSKHSDILRFLRCDDDGVCSQILGPRDGGEGG